MFCGLCRKGVSTREGIPQADFRKQRQAAETGVLAFWSLIGAAAYATLFFCAATPGGLI